MGIIGSVLFIDFYPISLNTKQPQVMRSAGFGGAAVLLNNNKFDAVQHLPTWHADYTLQITS